MASRVPRSPTLSAYVLHRYDWSESSLIIDLFSREQGRVAVAAKGAKRPFSQLRGVLLPFQRLVVSIGRHASSEETAEISNLRSADWTGGAAMLTGAALFSGFYLNELLLKLLARHDPHPALFDAYAATVAALGHGGEAGGQAALRAFEIVLLREIGLLPELSSETATRRPVTAAERYRLLADAGVVAAPGSTDGTVGGAALLAMQEALGDDDLAALQRAAAGHLPELRGVLRQLLAYHLGTDSLRTRRVMLEAQALGLATS